MSDLLRIMLLRKNNPLVTVTVFFITFDAIQRYYIRSS